MRVHNLRTTSLPDGEKTARVDVHRELRGLGQILKQLEQRLPYLLDPLGNLAQKDHAVE